MKTSDLVDDLIARAADAPRFMIGLAGAPGSGKSTLAKELCNQLLRKNHSVVVVPMDGFHFDDSVLNKRGHNARKGAYYTFDAAGFVHLIKRIKAQEPDIAIPVFDRTIELSRAAADVVDGTTRFIIVEGLYLLLQRQPWSEIKALFDVSIFLDVPTPELERRLTKRILDHGYDAAYAKAWIASNDMLNADEVVSNSTTADITLST